MTSLDQQQIRSNDNQPTQDNRGGFGLGWLGDLFRAGGQASTNGGNNLDQQQIGGSQPTSPEAPPSPSSRTNRNQLDQQQLQPSPPSRPSVTTAPEVPQPSASPTPAPSDTRQPRREQPDNTPAQPSTTASIEYPGKLIGTAPGMYPRDPAGTKGPIAQVQERLIQLGYKNLGSYGSNRDGVDGVYGALTRAEIIRFQRDNGLVADGIVGPRTWAKLFAS